MAIHGLDLKGVFLSAATKNFDRNFTGEFRGGQGSRAQPAKTFQQRGLDSFEPAGKLGELGGGGLLGGQQFAALRGKFLYQRLLDGLRNDRQ